MFNRILKLIFVFTSFAPVFLILWFIQFSKKWQFQDGILYLIAVIFLLAICLVFIKFAKSKLEKIPIKINSIHPSDKKVIEFFIIYLLPLINESALQVNLKVLLFILILFLIFVYKTNTYHFNPLLGFFDYHFYEVTIEGNVSYILMTRKNLKNIKTISQVIQVSDYMLLEV